MNTIAIAIPSRTEIFLKRTIEDVLEKSVTDIKVYPILDGYDPPANEIIDDRRVCYVRLPRSSKTQKRHGINHVVDISNSKYVMSLDAHCMLDKGWDEILLRDIEDDWIVIPRRNRLDAKNWCIQKQSDARPPIDYEYVMYPPKFDPIGFHGYKWDERTLSRWDKKIDDTITMQASMWVMSRDWYKRNEFMQVEGFTGWGQEAEELCFKTWMRGGRVVTNKNTSYSHLHKGREYGRMYFLPKSDTRSCNAYAIDYFVNNRDKKRIHDFVWLFEKFMPMPGWPKGWQEKLYSKNVQDIIGKQLETYK